MTNEAKYDAVIGLGTGIYKDGSIPESAKATVRKAVELYRSGDATHVIFAGKWSYSLEYVPPRTEATAMAEYAEQLGVRPSDVFIETTSVTTVSNFCRIKEAILMPYGWKRVIVVTTRPHERRTLYNLNRVLGKEYVAKAVPSEFSYLPDALVQLEAIEENKLKDAIAFLENVNEGDHVAIYDLAMEDLQRRYLAGRQQ